MSDIKEKLKSLIKAFEKDEIDYQELELELFDLFEDNKCFLFEWTVAGTIESMKIYAKNKKEAREEFKKINPNITYFIK